eukprot:scaffold190465_cov17-Tisochrysis_lutea.AAC.1
MQSKRGLAKDEAWKTIHNTKSAASLPACLWGSFQRKKLPVKAHDNPGKRGKMELKWYICLKSAELPACLLTRAPSTGQEESAEQFVMQMEVLPCVYPPSPLG